MPNLFCYDVNMRLSIRKAKLSELPVVQELNSLLFVSDSAHDPLLNLDWPKQEVGENYFKDKITGKSGVCFVAIADKKIVGYLAGSADSIAPEYRNAIVGNLNNMLVLKDYRGKGVGTKLIAKFTKWCKAMGVEKCSVSAYANNTDAVAFYRKCGFYDYSVRLEIDL